MLGSLVYVCPECRIAKQALQAFEDGVNMFIAFRHKDKSGTFSTVRQISLATSDSLAHLNSEYSRETPKPCAKGISRHQAHF